MEERNYRIYLIKNLITGKLYIGQTYKSIKERFNDHFHEAQNNSRKNCYLHNSMLKYGKENFSIELVEDNINGNDIDLKEQYYIQFYNTFYLNGNGYNLTLGGQGVHGYNHSEETKEKISKSSKESWDRIKLDEEKYNQIKQQKQSLGRWKWPDDSREKLSLTASKRVGDKNSFYGKHHTYDTKDIIGDKNSKPIQMYSLNNELIKEFKSGQEAAKYILENRDLFKVSTNKASVIKSLISKCCQDKVNSAYGYIWKFKCID